MNRIERRLGQLKEQGRKAFVTYMTAGLPDLETTEKIVKAQEEAGIDIIELGIPFSDPVADGPIIQDASVKAIANGSCLRKIFETMKNIRKDGSDVAIVFMMYYNSVMHYGVEAFVEKCVECGVDGVIIPDLPFEEQDELKTAMSHYENAPILIQLVSPVSKERIPMILENARGFVYCVSQMGVTGKNSTFHSSIREYLSEVKNVSKIPVMIGFGIHTATDVKPLQDVIDGAIVGSHFIKLLEENHFSEDIVKEYVRTFQLELNA